MKGSVGLLALVLLHCAVRTSAGFYTVSTQESSAVEGLHGRTVLLMEGGKGADTELRGLIQQYEGEGENALQAMDMLFGSAFRRFPRHGDNTMSWVGQQLQALEALQMQLSSSQLLPDCPLMKRSSTQPQPDLMSQQLMSHMVRSRFAPRLFELLDVQAQTEEESTVGTQLFGRSAFARPHWPTRAQIRFMGPSDLLFPADNVDAGGPALDAGITSANFAAVVGDGSIASARIAANREVSFDDMTVERAEGFQDEMLGEPMFDWRVSDNGRPNWGLLFFLALCVACSIVWAQLLLTWCSYRNSCRKARRAAKSARLSLHQPLLNPLEPEGPIDAAEFAKIDVATWTAAEVSAPSEQLVIVSYVPLAGEVSRK